MIDIQYILDLVGGKVRRSHGAHREGATWSCEHPAIVFERLTHGILDLKSLGERVEVGRRGPESAGAD